MAKQHIIWQDPAFRWLVGIGIAVTASYLALVGLTWRQDSLSRSFRWVHGGVGGLQAFLSALTALVVVYYLVETRRLRLISEQQRWPLIAFTLELEVVEPHQQGPVLYARNLGDGPGVNIHIIGLTTTLPMVAAPRSLVSVLSSGGKAAVVQWLPGANQETIRQDVGRMSLKVTCFDQTGLRQLGWHWQGLQDWPGEFTLESSTTSPPGAPRKTWLARQPPT